VTDRLEAVRDGDRDAFVAMVEAHGGALEALLEALDAPVTDEARVRACAAVWRAAALAEDVPERAFVVSTAGAALFTLEQDPAAVGTLAALPIDVEPIVEWTASVAANTANDFQRRALENARATLPAHANKQLDALHRAVAHAVGVEGSAALGDAARAAVAD
jgi:hypothetical protein